MGSKGFKEIVHLGARVGCSVIFNPLSPTSDLDRISPYIICTISRRQVMRIKKNIK